MPWNRAPNYSDVFPQLQRNSRACATASVTTRDTCLQRRSRVRREVAAYCVVSLKAMLLTPNLARRCLSFFSLRLLVYGPKRTR